MPPVAPGSRSRSWCFTFQNPTAALELRLANLADTPSVLYVIYGRETAPTTGTPHLQGYIVFSVRRRCDAIRALLAPAHVEIAHGSAVQNRDYCSKDGDFEEFGTIPDDVGQGRRTDIERYMQWLRDYDGYPNVRDIMLAFPGLYMRYRDRLIEFRDTLCTRPAMEDADYYEWQDELAGRLQDPCVDNRSIEFYVDPVGGSGKSWFIRKFLSEHPDEAQMLSIGKRDDLTYAIDETKQIFLVSIPRESMEFLNYSVLEMLKDQLVFSTKYQSRMKILTRSPHVVVFSNEQPDRSKLTDDRFKITNLSE